MVEFYLVSSSEGKTYSVHFVKVANGTITASHLKLQTNKLHLANDLLT